MARRYLPWNLPCLALLALVMVLSDRTYADPPGDTKSDAGSEEDYYELFEIFVDSMDHIERNYVKEISRRELIEAAIEGMVKRLDPHSSYINPEKVDAFRSSVESKFGGIGIHVAIDDGKLMVISPLVGAPAYEAGVLAGDHIVEVEGESTEGMTLDDAVRRLKGEVGTKVTVTVQNGPKAERRKVTIERAMVRVETVLGDRRNDDDSWKFMYDDQRGIGYIRVNSFSRDTPRELRTALTQLKKQNVHGLVLDLRFNPGGLLTSAIEICDLFISKGKIVSTKGRNTQERTWQAKAAGTFEGFPIVVLINHYSASASEIVSACLQDHGRAVVIGERSFGKGSVQNVIELEEGKSVLKLTTASYRRPSGKNIHRFKDAESSDEWGVKPDENYKVELTQEELKKLVEYRRRQYIARGKKPADTADASIDDPSDDDPSDDDASIADDGAEEGGEGEEPGAFVDRQLEKAIEYLSTTLARAEPQD